MSPLTVGSLCSGIGGLELGLEAHGMVTAWHAEIDDHASEVLARWWPGVPNHGTVKRQDWSGVEPVDVLCGGYPCQPFSHAGKRRGEDDPRHLWPHVAHALRVLRPRYAVLENVAGHLSLGFDAVLCDLAEAGFDAWWATVRASDVGAPHRRERLFIVAADASGAGAGRDGRGAPVAQESAGRRQPHETDAPVADGQVAADAGHRADDGQRSRPEPRQGDPAASDAGGERHGRGQDAGGVGRVDGADEGGARERERSRPLAGDRSGPAAADTDGGRLEVSQELDSEPLEDPADGHPRRGHADGLGDLAWGDYEPAIRRWEQLTRPVPDPTDDRGRLAPRFVEWMMGFDDGWASWLPRTAALRCFGNAVVPQVSALAWSLFLADNAQERAA